MSNWTDFLCPLDAIFLESGLLLEVVSTLVGVVIIVPLTARFVEHERHRREKSIRREALHALKDDAMHAVGSMKLAFVAVEGALEVGSALDFLRKAREATIAANEASKKRAVQALHDVQAKVQGWLHQADSEFSECHRLWAQLIGDMSIYNQAMEPEEQTRLLHMRAGAASCASFCFTFSQCIRAMLDGRRWRNPRRCDVSTVLDSLRLLISETGKLRAEEPWIIRALRRVPGGNAIGFQNIETLSGEEREKIDRAISELESGELIVDIEDLVKRFIEDRTLIDIEELLSSIRTNS